MQKVLRGIKLTDTKLEVSLMEIKKKKKKQGIDKGQAFDFGRTSEIYAQYRDFYPECMFQKLTDFEMGIQGQKILDLGTSTGVIPRGMYKYGGQWIGTDIAEEQIKQFDYEHKKMLEENYPENFTVKHKIFLTWYKIEK